VRDFGRQVLDICGERVTAVFISIGSNIGDKTGYCLSALDRMDRIPGCTVKARSSLYRTEPVGVEGQDWYVNGVAELEVELTARVLLDRLLAIEKEMGRERRKKWDSRTLDLDILLFGSQAIHEKDLIVPHPLMHERRFVLAPLTELAPDLIHPVLGKTITELLEKVPDDGQQVMPLKGL